MVEQVNTMTSGQSYMNDMLNMIDESEDLDSDMCEVSEFYKGLNVFVTGGTGFLGRLLIEKLLRSCPKIGKVYMLLRAKKGKTHEQRFKEHFDDVIYERLKQERPTFLKHIVVIEGDTSTSDLSLSTTDRIMLIENTHIVFHGAATVRFDESVRQAVNINVRGTKLVAQFAREMKNLKAFIHISTAYSNCIFNHIDEKFYDPPINPDKILTLVETLDDDSLEHLKTRLMGKWPNSYAFSKALGEEVVRQNSHGKPMCIIRPSIVIATDREPIRGWINNYYGATGIAIGAGIGLLRSMHCESTKIADIIPADYVINNIIVAAWDTAKMWKIKQNKIIEKKEFTENQVDPMIYNVVSSCQNPITWGKFMYLNEMYTRDVPPVLVFWYYTFMLNKHLWVHNICVFLLHIVPGAIVDSLAYVTGRKPILMKAYSKIHKFSDVISYFSTNQWKFNNKNVVDLWNKISPADKQKFYFNLDTLDWNDYFYYHVRGLRVYILKDPLSSIPIARVKRRRLMIAHYTIVIVSCLLIGWAVLSLLRLLLSWCTYIN